MAFVSVGDNIGYADGRLSSFFCQVLEERGIPSVYGNHEDWSRSGRLFLSPPGLPRDLSPEALTWCQGLPYRLRVEGHPALAGGVHVVHTLPDWAYVRADSAVRLADREEARIVFCGHSHKPAIYALGRRATPGARPPPGPPRRRAGPGRSGPGDPLRRRRGLPGAPAAPARRDLPGARHLRGARPGGRRARAAGRRQDRPAAGPVPGLGQDRALVADGTGQLERCQHGPGQVLDALRPGRRRRGPGPGRTPRGCGCPGAPCGGGP